MPGNNEVDECTLSAYLLTTDERNMMNAREGKQMLVLSRRPNETIVIGGNIRVTILKSRSGVVRLGIDAPAEVAVHREEVQTQIQSEQLCLRSEPTERTSTEQHRTLDSSVRWQTKPHRFG